MKKLLAILAFSLLVGCDYNVPLVTNPSIAIDKSVLGLWQTTDNGKTVQLLVLPLDQDEYLVSYPSASTDGMFARACLCQTAGKTLVQLKWFGTADGKQPDPGDKRVFQFLSYSVASNKLTVQMLNTGVVNKDAATTDELAKSIAANLDKTNLFGDAVVFTKVPSAP